MMVTKTTPVSKVMTQSPHCIGVDQPLARAHEVMREHGIRHLPVLDGGKLVGIVSHRDLELVETFPDIDPKSVKVEEAMSPEPYAVNEDALLGEVAMTMAEHKYGCAVVHKGEHVLGMLTTVDICRLFAEKLGAGA